MQPMATYYGIYKFYYKIIYTYMARIFIFLPSQVFLLTIVKNHILISFSIEAPFCNLQNAKKILET